MAGEEASKDVMGWRVVGQQRHRPPPLTEPPTPRSLYGAPGECEISTRPAETKAAEGGTVHAILPGLKGPDTLWASSCVPEQVLGTAALYAPAPPRQPPPTGATVKAYNGCH